MGSSVYAMHGYNVHARDGVVGLVDQLLFDDRTGKVRYLVVRIGGWLLGRRVLVVPEVLGTLSATLQTIDVALTQQQLEHCPTIEAHPPVSRQRTSAYLYDNAPLIGWDMLPGSWLPGVSWYAAQPDDDAPSTRQIVSTRCDAHLRSTREVIGYRLQASDGAIGRVVDFIVDDSAWTIRAVVVDTGTWWPGQRVVLPWQRISDFHWLDSTVEVGLLRATVKRHPAYDPARLQQHPARNSQPRA